MWVVFLSPEFLVVDGFMPNSIGKKSGLIKGDRIVAINEFETSFLSNGALIYLKENAGKPITLTIQREMIGWKS